MLLFVILWPPNVVISMKKNAYIEVLYFQNLLKIIVVVDYALTELFTSLSSIPRVFS